MSSFLHIFTRLTGKLAVLILTMAIGSESLAQRQYNFGSGFGGGVNGLGNFRTSGQANYGGPGLLQHLGGARYNNGVGFTSRYPIGDRTLGGTYSSTQYTYGTSWGRHFGSPHFGVARGGYSVLNSPNVYYSPVIWSTPYYSYSPSVFGYGTGVFSPNFPSGNYISNGYVGVVPTGVYGSYDPWGSYQAGWPYITGINPYSPGAIIAPTMLNLNMNVNVQPVALSGASYSYVDPRLIDQLAPAPQQDGLMPNQFPAFPDADQPPLPQEEMQVPAIQDGAPVLNEFESLPAEPEPSTLTDKIQSLRYQSSGDDAFRKADYATADVLYATAIKTAPDRRAPYFRMAFCRIAIQDFSEAVRYLKTGLAMENDASRPWVTADELYGSRVAERARSHSGPLWNWLAERPLSADRLLLAGTFQKLRGFDKPADEMLDMAWHEGPEAARVEEVLQLAKNDIGPRAISEDMNHMIDAESNRKTLNDSADANSVDQSEGIFLRGKDVAAREAANATTPPLEPPKKTAPEPPKPGAYFPPFEFEIPQSE